MERFLRGNCKRCNFCKLLYTLDVCVSWELRTNIAFFFLPSHFFFFFFVVRCPCPMRCVNLALLFCLFHLTPSVQRHPHPLFLSLPHFTMFIAFRITKSHSTHLPYLGIVCVLDGVRYPQVVLQRRTICKSP